MKRWIGMGVLMLFFLSGFGEQPVENACKVLINQTRIERFNQVQYDENNLIYQQLKEAYSAGDMKLIYHLYQYGELDLSNKKMLDEKLAVLNQEVNDPENTLRKEIPLYSNK